MVLLAQCSGLSRTRRLPDGALDQLSAPLHQVVGMNAVLTAPCAECPLSQAVGRQQRLQTLLGRP